jgi:hypothetical protein
MMTARTITLTRDELDAMTSDELCELLLSVYQWQATCVVQRADGSIKYDQPELAGTYGEQYLRRESDG